MSTTSQKASSVLSREIRVFLSSTFRDMEVERNHLLKQVFPKVRAACLARQVGFTEIDLRWGVTEEESKNGATVEICLKEIDRCREFPPFFIGFLGERYGWIPKHEDLAAYWQKNAESEYAQLIQRAIKRGISVTELEMELAVLEEGAADKIASHALFLLRDRTLTDSLYRQETGKIPNPADPAFYDPADGKLEALKERIRHTPFLGTPDDKASYTTVEQFGEAVETYLLAQLDHHFPEDAVPTPLERQQQAHAAFRYHRLQNFLPREDVRKQVLKALNKRFDTPHLGPLLLAGPSGQGKSALMADLARHLEATYPEWIVLDHYIGADDTNSLDSWARRILETLHPRIHDLVGAVPVTQKDQKEALSTWIAMACRRQEQTQRQEPGTTRLVLILDALDQCSDGGKDLELLKPEVLGADALVVASAADGTAGRDAAKDYETLVVPPLKAKLKVRMIRDTLARYRKKLTPELAQRLAEAPQSGSPLFLSLALEELRLDASHESLTELVADILTAKDAEQFFLNNFLLDADNGRPELPTLAAAFMALLGASHAGLSENELADLLALPTDPKAKDTKKPRLPQIHLSRLLANLQPFLLNKAGRRAPMHRIFGQAALNHLGERVVREQLYVHFSPGYGNTLPDFKARGAAEALYQANHTSNDAAGKTRLADDLAQLHVPAKLCESDVEIVADALNKLNFEEKSALAQRWRKQVTPLAEEDIERIGGLIRDFAAWISARIGHYPAARALHEPLLESRRRILGEAHLATIETMNDLAITMLDQYDLPGARQLLDQVREYRCKLLGENHRDSLVAIDNLAATLLLQGNIVDARELREYVCQNIVQLGADDPDAIQALSNLAFTLKTQGHYSRAKELNQQVLNSYQRIQGDEHPSTLRSMLNLGAVLFDLDEFPESKRLLERVVCSFSRIYGLDHPSYLAALSNLALTIMAGGELHRARVIQEQVLTTRSRILGRDHRSTLIAMNNLAGTIYTLGNFQEARALQEEVIELHRLTNGDAHTTTLVAMDNLANTLRAQGDLLGAKELQEKALAGFRHLHNDENPNTLDCMANLAITLDALGLKSEADSLRTEVRRLSSASTSTTTKGNTMRLTDTVKQWLKEKEWEDEPEIDEENQTSSTGFDYGIDDFSLNCWIDVAEKSGFVKVFMYFRKPNTPAKRADEVQEFCTAVTNRILMGKLQFRPDERDICYLAAMDFENAACEPAHIANLFNSGVTVLGAYLPKYMAVCFGGKTAEETLSEED